MRALGLLLGLFLLTAADLSAEPDLEIAYDRIEFGYIPFGSVVSHTVWLKSTGSDTLVVDTIITGCSCATSPIPNARIAPADSLEVTFYWDLQRRIGPSGVYPRIHTNARPEPYHVHMTGTTTKSAAELRPITILPFRLGFARTSVNSVDSIEVTVRNHSDHTIHLTRISRLPEQIELVVPDSVAAGGTESGWAVVRPEFLDKEFEGSMTFQLSDSQERSITIPFQRKFYLPEGAGQ